MRRRAAFVLLLSLAASLSGAAERDALEESLRATELAFAASLAEGDFDAFVSFLDEEAVFVSAATLRGRDDVAAAWKAFFEPGGAKLRWRPCRVAVDAAGELGLSTGPYWVEEAQGVGEGELLQGTFFSIWRLQADGSWRIAFDSGTDAAPGAAARTACPGE